MDTFTAKDKSYIASKGISLETITSQVGNFRQGFPFANLVKPATPGDGIEVLPDKEIDSLINYYNEHSRVKKVVKFVPASGAASRMFKSLFEYLSEANATNQRELLNRDKAFNSPWNFIMNIRKFAFYHDLHGIMKTRGINLEEELEKNNFSTVIQYLVEPAGLDYGNLPKGLLKFHDYFNRSRVAMEEHLAEASQYATSVDRKAYVHFTVSAEHLDKFREKIVEVQSHYEDEYGIRFDVSFSLQKSSTDTIAVDMDNNPFREPDGTLVFRPGGHGALIENLGDMDGDLIFIKNIDNVVPDRLKPETTRYKKAIGGLLLRLQSQAFAYLEKLHGSNPENELIDSMVKFAREELKIKFPDGFDFFTKIEKAAFLSRLLDRPIRICGMVRNEGEPGGGPFWIRDRNNQVSLQIVESSQIDPHDPKQVKHLQDATHFNPVDLVCGTKDFRGNKFDLHRFIDPTTGFISMKSKGGRDLKAQELPGLWNGAMADWITIFVEVPVITFNPVKTVNDLLRAQHQNIIE
jgi:hypothetical protein